jgi:cold shock CspA family protein
MDPSKAFGFIAGVEISYFFRLRDVAPQIRRKLKIGLPVVFDNGLPVKGPRAVNVRLTDAMDLKAGMRMEERLGSRGKTRVRRPNGPPKAGIGGRVIMGEGQSRKIGSHRDNRGH